MKLKDKIDMKKSLFLITVSASLAIMHGASAADVEIVLPQNANAVEQTAADELVEHWRLVTGDDVTVVTNAVGTARWVFRLGRAARLDLTGLDKNDGRVCIADGMVDISGVDDGAGKMSSKVSSGTLFAVYSFIERELGVRWLWPGEIGTVYQRKKHLVLHPKSWTVRYMAFSEWRAPAKVDSPGWSDRKCARKFYEDQSIWLRRHRFSTCDRLAKGHAFTKWFHEYGEKHPEWFNELPDGKRRSDPFYSHGRPEFISLCVSNRDLVKEIVRKWAESNEGEIINGNENDTAGKCCCANCLAADCAGEGKVRHQRALSAYLAKSNSWYRALGSLSTRYAAFYNALLDEGRKVRPDCRVIAGVYANYSQPPMKGTRMDRNIILRFCPPVMYPWTGEKKELFKRCWQGWSDTGARLMLRPNFTLDGHNFPLIYHEHYVECYDFLRSRGLAAVDMDSLRGVYGANGLTTYVIASKNSNPDALLCSLENEYFGAFGASASVMRECCAMFKKASESGYATFGEEDRIEGGGCENFMLKAYRVFSPELLKSAIGKITAAMASEKDPLVVRRLDFVRVGLTDALLVLKTQRGFVDYQKSGERQPFASAYSELIDFRRRNESLGYLNMANTDYYESRHWPRHLAMIDKDARELAGWELKLNPDLVTDGWEKIDRFWYWRPDYNDIGWYRCRFSLSADEVSQFRRVVFGAVDGIPVVYLNGRIVQDGHPIADPGMAWRTPFAVNANGLLKVGVNELLIRLDKKVSGRRGIIRPVYLDGGVCSSARFSGAETSAVQPAPGYRKE